MRRISLKIVLILFPCILFLQDSTYPEQKAGTLFPVAQAVVGGEGNIAEYSFSSIAEDAAEHIVYISAKRMARRTPFSMGQGEQPFPGPNTEPRDRSEQLESSVGSGVLISNAGIVVTNNHVVEDAVKITVTCTTKRQFNASVVGTDPSTDLAVIRLEEKCDDLEPIKFGDSDKVRVGDMVLAAGNPFALNRSVSMGIVSALQRANFGEVEYENFIQTDAAINPGNSGGALVNMRGELIGINSAILSQTGGSVGIGFAIPSNMVRQVADSILKSGKIHHGTLGIAIQKVDQDIIDAFKLATDKGVIITHVANGGAAERAGLQRGDVILKVNDEEILRRNQFRNKIAFTPPGAKIHLTVLRSGKQKVLDATVTEEIREQKVMTKLRPKPGGIRVAELSSDLRRQIGVPNEVQGKVVVVEVEPTSAADVSGFNPGDIIIEMNGKPVTSVTQYTDMYKTLKGNVVFLIRRPDGFFFRLLRNEP